MHWFTRLTLLMIAASLSFLCAAVFLIYQYKQGIPYSFTVNMVLATLVGVVAPLLTVIGFGLLTKELRAQTRFAVYFAVGIGLSLLLVPLFGRLVDPRRDASRLRSAPV